MFCYKRGIGKQESLKNIDFLASNINKNVLTSLSANFGSFKPYNGMYIKNSKILLENVFEEIELKDKIYKMYQLETNSKTITCDDNIMNINLNENKIEYDIGSIYYNKKLYYKDDILCMDYEIENNLNYNIRFKVIPLLTNRTLYDMKTAQFIKFNQRKIKNGTVVNISITNDVNFYIKSNEFEFDKEVKFLSNVVHNDVNGTKFQEDLYTPGKFLLKLKKGEKRIIHICFSTNDFDISSIDFDKEYKDSMNLLEKLNQNVPIEFTEQRDLQSLLNKFSFEDKLVNTLPYTNFTSIENIEKNLDIENAIQILLDNLKSIDGMYLVFDKYKEASTKLINIRRYIKEIEYQNRENEQIRKKVILLKLWYGEIVNRLLEKQDFLADVYFNSTKEIVYDVLDEKSKNISFTDLEYIALTYNIVKIYQKMLILLDKNDSNIDGIDIAIKSIIEEKYLNSQKNLLKRKINDIGYDVFPEMIYTLSLSYPCFVGDISIKVLDTIFKELYTPYGLRKYKKGDNKNNFHEVYPEYMAHFVKANLRQNGLTNISKKISYNLVKELIQEINKRINCGVNKVYDLSKNVVTMPADLLTISEVCRLYDMLT